MYCEHYWDRADEEALVTDVINESLAIKFIKQPEMSHLQVSTIENISANFLFMFIVYTARLFHI